MNDITNTISNENKRAVLMGDINVDLLKFDEHNKTNEFLNSMATNGMFPLVTKPT